MYCQIKKRGGIFIIKYYYWYLTNALSRMTNKVMQSKLKNKIMLMMEKDVKKIGAPSPFQKKITTHNIKA